MNARRQSTTLTLRLLASFVVCAAAWPAGATPAAWIRDHAVALPACSEQTPAGQLAGMAPMVGAARVVALGEMAHGVHEPLAFRNCLFRYLVEQQGFTAIAIESGLSESQRLQAYVAGGPGDARRLVRESLTWGFWRAAENVELVEWMHRYNADPRHTRKIRFYGIDLSGGDGSGAWRDARITLDAALTFLARNAPQETRRARAAVEPYLTRFSQAAYSQLSDDEKRSLGSALRGLVQAFDRERRVLLAQASEDELAWAQQNAVLARQLEATFRVASVENVGDSLPRDGYRADEARDAAMAENALWAIAREGPSGRVLVFAHNGHVMNARTLGGVWSAYRRAPRSMGHFLRAALGDRLRIIATSATASGPGLKTSTQPPGSIDQAFAARNDAPVVVDLRQARTGPMARWTAQQHSLRTNLDTELLVVPRSATDLIVHFPMLSARRYSEAH